MILPSRQLHYVRLHREEDQAAPVDDIPQRVITLQAEEQIISREFWSLYSIVHLHTVETLELMHRRNALRVRIARLQARYARAMRL